MLQQESRSILRQQEPDPIVTYIGQIKEDYASTYRIVETPEWWYLVPRQQVAFQKQGWKLHLPILPKDALSLLQTVAPLLLERNIQWKVVHTQDHLIRFSSPPSPLPQLGKFITIYPPDDHMALELAELLHTATEGFAGPVIPSDYRYQEGSQVYYRYGSFKDQFFYDAHTSLRTPAIMTPDGHPIRDERGLSPRHPEWTNNPFPPHPKRPQRASDGLFGKNLKVRGVLSQSIKGGVYVVAKGEETFILKEARFGTCPDTLGRDARDRLTNEFTLLQKLAPLRITPQPIDLFDKERNRYLLMEHLPGLSLRQYIERLNYQGEADREELQWVCESLVKLVRCIHDTGLVLRDLSPNNVLVARSGCTLIDIELAHLPSYETRPFTGFTIGYVPLGFEKAPRTEQRYDLYALGAILYNLVTGAIPFLSQSESILPRLSALLDTHSFLRDTSLQPIADLARYLLTEQKFPPTAALFTPIEEKVGSATQVETLCNESDVRDPETSLPFTRAELLRNATSIADYLHAQADWENPRQLWPFASQRDKLFHSASFYGGTSGIACFLLEVAQVTGVTKYATFASKMMEWVLRHHPFSAPASPTGLYFGYAGVPWVLGMLAEALGEPSYLTRAQAISWQIAETSLERLDITHGIAGIGMMHLELFRRTRDRRQLEQATLLGKKLIKQANADGQGGITWQEEARSMWGFAHGSSGIAHYLLALYSQTHDPELREVIKQANTALYNAALPTAHGRGRSWLKDTIEQGIPWTHWCHGASGIGSYVLGAARYLHDTQLEELALQAAYAIQFSSGLASCCQCHGLAGDGEYLVQAGRVLQHQELKQAGIRFARKLYDYRLTEDDTPGWVWNSEALEVDPVYMTGYTGVYSFLLRLTHETLSRPLYWNTWEGA